MGRSGYAKPRGSLFLTLALLLPGCGSTTPSSPSPGDPLFLIRACRGSEAAPQGETFRVAIGDAAVAGLAEALIGVTRGDPRQRILLGTVRRGSGGFNDPWSWHLDPGTVAFVEATTELCDGCPNMVESDVDAWIGQVGQYCPWSTEVVRRER